MEIKEYFDDNAPQAGKAFIVWNRVAERISQSKIKTMQEFGDKDFRWLLSLFHDDPEALSLAERIMDKYCTETYVSKLRGLAEKGITPVEMYFRAHGVEAASESLISRAVSTLRFIDIETMDQLCGASLREYSKMRNVGEKTLELVLLMRKKYMRERNLTFI